MPDKELRHCTVRRWLLPTDCECATCRQNGKTGVLCKLRTWVPPPRLQLSPPRDVEDCLKRYAAAHTAFDKKMDGPLKGVDCMQELEKLVLTQEALLIWLCEQIYKLPGQPNSMDHMMLCDVEDLRKLHVFYSIEANQKKGLEMKEKIRKKYG